MFRLYKSVYGPEQAPRVWYHTLSAFLVSIYFRKLIKGRCLFILIIDNMTCYIAVYVDDLLIIAPTTALVRQIKSALNKGFYMSDLGEVTYLLGWSIERNRK